MLRLLSLTALIFFTVGCRARELTQSIPPPATEPSDPAAVEPPKVPLTHRSVPLPPPARRSDSTLWVALAAHLGASPAAPPLDLVSAGQPLQISDSNGNRWSAAAAQVRWRSVPHPPQALARQVAGPYASFESAERAAMRWRSIGVDALVAHPSEWEVWAPASAPVPEGDLNRDGRVDSADLGLLLASWGPCEGCDADFDGDGLVGGSDLGRITANWNP